MDYSQPIANALNQTYLFKNCSTKQISAVASHLKQAE